MVQADVTFPNCPSTELLQIHSKGLIHPHPRPQLLLWPHNTPTISNSSRMARTVSSHFSGVSCPEMTGLTYWGKNTSSFLQVRRKKPHSFLSIRHSSPSHHTSDVDSWDWWTPVSLQQLQTQGHHYLCLIGQGNLSQGTKLLSWRSRDSKVGTSGFQGHQDKGTSLQHVMSPASVNMSGTAGPRQKPPVWTLPPFSMSWGGWQGNLKNAHLPHTNTGGRMPEQPQRQMPPPPEISWQRCHQPQLWPTPQAEISGWGCRPRLHTSPSFEEVLGHSWQMQIPGSLLRHVGFLIPVEIKSGKLCMVTAVQMWLKRTKLSWGLYDW